jgi:hypothetical protein
MQVGVRANILIVEIKKCNMFHLKRDMIIAWQRMLLQLKHTETYGWVRAR